MNLTKLSLGLTGCFFAAALSGCVFVADNSGYGSIVVDVIIEGRYDKAVCDEFAVDDVDIDVIDEDGVTTPTTISCGDSVIVDHLDPGLYTVKISLVADNVAVSDTVSVENVRVIKKGETKVTADFPADSID